MVRNMPGNRQPAAPFSFPEPKQGALWEGLTMIKKILLALGITSMTLTAAACNTVRGAGSDLQSAANAVDEET